MPDNDQASLATGTQSLERRAEGRELIMSDAGQIVAYYVESSRVVSCRVGERHLQQIARPFTQPPFRSREIHRVTRKNLALVSLAE